MYLFWWLDSSKSLRLDEVLQLVDFLQQQGISSCDLHFQQSFGSSLRDGTFAENGLVAPPWSSDGPAGPFLLAASAPRVLFKSETLR